MRAQSICAKVPRLKDGMLDSKDAKHQRSRYNLRKEGFLTRQVIKSSPPRRNCTRKGAA